MAFEPEPVTAADWAALLILAVEPTDRALAGWRIHGAESALTALADYQKELEADRAAARSPKCRIRFHARHLA